jgi:hypothetical protein
MNLLGFVCNDRALAFLLFRASEHDASEPQRHESKLPRTPNQNTSFSRHFFLHQFLLGKRVNRESALSARMRARRDCASPPATTVLKPNFVASTLFGSFAVGVDSTMRRAAREAPNGAPIGAPRFVDAPRREVAKAE